MATFWNRTRHGIGKWMNDTKDVLSGDIFRIPTPTAVPIVHFHTQEDIDKFKVVCDSALGGHSTASFELGEGSTPDTKCGVLSGYLSMAQASNTQVRRSGYVGIITPEQFPPWNIAYAPEIEVRCRTDGRMYAINIHCDMAFNTGLIWQGHIHCPGGQWNTMQLPLSRFMPVLAGRVAAGKWTMDMENIIKVGISIMGKQGPFKFELEHMRAVPEPTPEITTDR